MKTLTLLILSFSFFVSLSQTTAIADANFEQALINQGYDSGAPDGLVTTANISSVVALDVSGSNIADLLGIEDFALLEELNCRDNSLTSLDLSQNTSLKSLICSQNSITSLDMTQNAFLNYLDCDTNQIASIDVTQNMVLLTLSCTFNQLVSLDVTQCVSLVELYCFYNKLSALDVSNNTKLTTLACNHNNLEGLDVSQNIVLTYLNVHHNILRCLNVSNGNNQNITDLTTYFNTYLYCIEVDDEVWSMANWTSIYGVNPPSPLYFEAQNSFSDNCNFINCGVVVTGLSKKGIKLDAKKKMKIYPNPFSCSTRIEIPIDNGKTYTLSVTDILGNIVRVQDNISDSYIGFEKNDLTEGLYFLELRSENKSFNGKVIIK
jgi:hypothetical protein